jgi:hypothetical protein
VANIHGRVRVVHNCIFCGASFENLNELKAHRLNHEPSTGFIVISSAHRKKCVIYRKTYGKKMATLDAAFYNDKRDLFKLINFELSNRNSMRASIIFHAEFLKANPTEADEGTRYEVCVRAQSSLITNQRDIRQLMRSSKKNTQQRIDDFCENGSGKQFVVGVNK